MGLKAKGTIVTLLMVIVFATITNAAWEGPVEIISGTWGANAGQFGLDQQDSGDFLPRDFGVDKDGIIVIGDKVNNRIQIFKPDGSLSKVINRPTEIKDILWPWTLIILPDGNSVLAELSIFDYTGVILSKIDIKRSERYAVTNGYIIYNMDTKSYSLYSPTGALIRTTTERPLELGKVKEKKTAAGYTYTVQYPDLVNPNVTKTWEIARDNVSKMYSFVRDKNGILYAVSRGQVIRYDDQGKEVGRLMLPKKRFKPTTIPPDLPPGAEIPREISEEYGEPVISPNGDVYTWKRTPTAYSIIKWTWR